MLQEKRPDEMRSLVIALVISILLFILQLSIYFSSNILIILAGALDTLSDVLISSFLLASIHWASKPADEMHMFGHGRIQNVAALVTATIFIFILAVETIRAAVPKLWEAQTGEIQNVGLAFIVTVIAVVVYAIPLIDILRIKQPGPALKAQLYALIEMEIAFGTSLISIVLVAKGKMLADPITSIFIGAIIAFTGIKLFMDNAQYLIGKAPPPEFLAEIIKTAQSVPGVLDVHDIIAEYVGPNVVHSGLHITVAHGTAIEEADRVAEEVRQRVSQATGCRYCVIHVDPDKSGS